MASSRLAAAAAVAAAVAVVLAQAPKPGTAPRFDAASVRVQPRRPLGLAAADALPEPQVTPGRLRFRRATLEDLIRYAYNLKSYQPVSGGPDWARNHWINPTGFAVRATFPAEEGLEPVRMMLQALLAERFRLAVRPQSQAGEVYEMTVAPNGLKLQKYDRNTPPPTAPGCDYAPCYRTAKTDATMDDVTAMLGRLTGRPVIDRTGLSGRYSYAFSGPLSQAALNALRKQIPSIEPYAGAAPPLLTVIEKELGLHLQPGHAQVPGLLIVHAEMPTSN